MCGIVGSVAPAQNLNFARALNAITHRGPDFGAQEEHRVANCSVMLGHRRLSILDLTVAANQPFKSDDGQSVLIFNGEIYNHNALREDLRRKGCIFRTRSDTEVLSKGISVEGPDFIKKLNGMFAFALLDKARKSLLLCRDPFGIKPLYVSHRLNGQLLFASELRSLAVLNDEPLKPDRKLLSEFLLNGFLYEPNSGFENVKKVAPGCWMQVDLESMVETHSQYYDVLVAPKINSTFGDLIEQQVSLELEADVQTGIFFSGGLDSSVVGAAAARPVDALFVDYGGSDSRDGPFVEQIAKALNLPLRRVLHEVNNISATATLDNFRQVAEGTEEPVSDFTYIATRELSRHAREAGFKVMLSGMGGDEIFGGYPRHLPAQHWRLLNAIGQPLAGLTTILATLPGWAKRANRLQSFLRASDFAEAYTSLVGYFSVGEVSKLVGNGQDCADHLDRLRALLRPVSGQSGLRQAMFLDRHGFLSHNLTVTDKASMAESIEVRVPMLNTKLERYSKHLADGDLISGSSGKMPMRRYLSDRLPDRLINRPKVGFNPPLDGRIRQLGRGMCLQLTCSGKISDYLDKNIIKSWVDSHFDGKANHSYRIWQLIYLGLWLETSVGEVRKYS